MTGWIGELEKCRDYLADQCETKDARIRELESWIGELEKARDYLSGQCEMKDARIRELEEWCQAVTDGKDYLESQWRQAQSAETVLQKKLNVLLADVEIQKIIQKRSYNV